jgi:hypothetical protein
MHPNDTKVLCGCGCGESVNWWRGVPRKYIAGHHRRLSPVEYVEEDRGYVTPCWTWQRGTARGYGVAVVNRKTIRAHRLYYIRANGPVPAGLDLDHLCRNRRCVNPDHLEPVTRAVNAQRGERTKLSPADVETIRNLAGVISQAELSRRFGVTSGHICRIIQGKERRH